MGGWPGAMAGGILLAGEVSTLLKLAGAASFFMANPTYHGKIKMQLVVVVVKVCCGKLR
jgi:hypothetical protein